MRKASFKKLRLWFMYPVFLVYPFAARITDSSFKIGLFFMLLGLGIRFWASGYISKSRELATSGPYAYTRNPLYVGNFILGLGITAISNNIWLVIYYMVSFSVLYYGTIREEEKVLKEKFGDAYRDYIHGVPVFFPSFAAYGKSQKKRFEIRQSFKNGEFIRLCGFLLLALFLNLYYRPNKTAFFLFVVFFLLLWFNIFIRRRSERKPI